MEQVWKGWGGGNWKYYCHFTRSFGNSKKKLMYDFNILCLSHLNDYFENILIIFCCAMTIRIFPFLCISFILTFSTFPAKLLLFPLSHSSLQFCEVEYYFLLFTDGNWDWEIVIRSWPPSEYPLCMYAGWSLWKVLFCGCSGLLADMRFSPFYQIIKKISA